MIPPLCHVLANTAPSGALAGTHLQIIEALGALHAHPESTRTLRTVLYRGSWWAPARTATLRRAAAAALMRIGSADTVAVVEEAARTGGRRVRQIARAKPGIRAATRSGACMSASHRAKIAEEIARRLAAALRGAQLYAPDHPIVKRNVGALAETIGVAIADNPTVTIGIVEDDLVVGDVPVPRAADTMGELMRRLQQAGIERIVIEAGVEHDEITDFVQSVARTDRGMAASDTATCRTSASASCRPRSGWRRPATWPRFSACTRTPPASRSGCGTARAPKASPTPMPRAASSTRWPRRWRRIERRSSRWRR